MCRRVCGLFGGYSLVSLRHSVQDRYLVMSSPDTLKRKVKE